MKPKNQRHCYGCRHLTSRWLGDGSTQYGCGLNPGLVLGTTSAFDDDEPIRCKRYEKPGAAVWTRRETDRKTKMKPTIETVYEKYKHLDEILSDTESFGEDITIHRGILREFWEAIKRAARDRG